MVSLIQNILKKNLDYSQVILAKTSQKMTVNLLMMVLIDLPIIKFTCQHHVSGYVCLVWHLLFFLLLVEIISSTTLLIIIHFFVLKHEKQTLTTFTQNLKVKKKQVFFSNLFCGSTRFSPPTLKITWAWEDDAPVITWYEQG